MPNKIHALIGSLILVLLLTVSFVLRVPDFKSEPGIQNLEATYHVIWTATALNESPSENHLYLPTVTLGVDANKQITWGNSLPTKTGEYVYTSFTPAGFIAPYSWFKVFSLTPSIQNLAYFNTFIGSIGALALFYFLLSLLRFNGHTPAISSMGALIGCMIGIFSHEALRSTGLVYWSQSLYQPIFVLSLYFIFKWLTSSTPQIQRKFAGWVILTAFLGPMVEWTGYIFNLGFIVLLLLNRLNTRSVYLAMQILGTTIVAGVLTVLHYSLAVGFMPTIVTFLARFSDRGTSFGTFPDLLQAYGHSYGIFIVVIMVIMVLAYFRNLPQAINHQTRITAYILILACIPVLENFLLLQHAIQFSFDRLKFAIPSAIIISFAFAHLKNKGRVVLLAVVIAASVHGYQSYRNDLKTYVSWREIDSKNKVLVSEIKKKVNWECTIFATNTHVRGYANLLLHRGIYELHTLKSSSKLQSQHKSCALVYLEATLPFTDLPEYRKAVISFNTGNTEVIVAK